MRRRKEKPNLNMYVKMRIEQLTEDMNKTSNSYDKQWYQRMIQELSWVIHQQHNCYMENASA